MFKHWFWWKYQYNKYMFNFIDIYSFIPVSSCVDMGPRVLFCPGAYNIVKMALNIISVKYYPVGKFMQSNYVHHVPRVGVAIVIYERLNSFGCSRRLQNIKPLTQGYLENHFILFLKNINTSLKIILPLS